MSASNLNEELQKLKSENEFMNSQQLKDLKESHGQEIQCLDSLQNLIEEKQIPVDTVELIVDIVKKEKNIDSLLHKVLSELGKNKSKIFEVIERLLKTGTLMHNTHVEVNLNSTNPNQDFTTTLKIEVDAGNSMQNNIDKVIGHVDGVEFDSNDFGFVFKIKTEAEAHLQALFYDLNQLKLFIQDELIPSFIQAVPSQFLAFILQSIKIDIAVDGLYVILSVILNFPILHNNIKHLKDLAHKILGQYGTSFSFKINSMLDFLLLVQTNLPELFSQKIADPQINFQFSADCFFNKKTIQEIFQMISEQVLSQLEGHVLKRFKAKMLKIFFFTQLKKLKYTFQYAKDEVKYSDDFKEFQKKVIQASLEKDLGQPNELFKKLSQGLSFFKQLPKFDDIFESLKNNAEADVKLILNFAVIQFSLEFKTKGIQEFIIKVENAGQ